MHKAHTLVSMSWERDKTGAVEEDVLRNNGDGSIWVGKIDVEGGA